MRQVQDDSERVEMDQALQISGERKYKAKRTSEKALREKYICHFQKQCDVAKNKWYSSRR